MDPIAILFEEPTSALDLEMTTEVLDVMVKLAEDGMKWGSRARWRTASCSWIKAASSRTPTRRRFRHAAKPTRQLFLSKILQH
jgi:glutamate/aspartate transport system ATP-binding protein